MASPVELKKGFRNFANYGFRMVSRLSYRKKVKYYTSFRLLFKPRYKNEDQGKDFFRRVLVVFERNVLFSLGARHSESIRSRSLKQ